MAHIASALQVTVNWKSNASFPHHEAALVSVTIFFVLVLQKMVVDAFFFSLPYFCKLSCLEAGILQEQLLSTWILLLA